MQKKTKFFAVTKLYFANITIGDCECVKNLRFLNAVEAKLKKMLPFLCKKIEDFFEASWQQIENLHVSILTALKPEVSTTMKIRAHHLLCMQGFQGYGYSEDFSKNMTKIVEILRSFPEKKIQVVNECDIICSCCPYNVKEICSKDPESYEKIMRMDTKIIEKLELSCGDIFEAGKIFSHVNKKLKSYSDINEICGDCKWSEKCLWLISRSK